MPPERIHTERGDKLRAAFTVDYHPLLIGHRIFYNSGLRIEKVHIANHDISDVPFIISMS